MVRYPVSRFLEEKALLRRMVFGPVPYVPRKLPRQGDTANGELRASRLARYVAGGRPANASWGRSSL